MRDVRSSMLRSAGLTVAGIAIVAISGCGRYVTNQTYLATAMEADGGQAPLYYVAPRDTTPGAATTDEAAAGADQPAERRGGALIQVDRDNPLPPHVRAAEESPARSAIDDAARRAPALGLRFEAEVNRELDSLERELAQIESLAYRKGSAALNAYESGLRDFKLSRDLIHDRFARLTPSGASSGAIGIGDTDVARAEIESALADAKAAVRDTSVAVQQTQAQEGSRIPSSGPK